MRRRLLAAVATLVALASACGGGSDASGTGTTAAEPAAATTVEPAAETTAPSDPATTEPAEPTTSITRPSWLGTRVLEAGPDGPAAPQPTPPELDPRILPTVDALPPPAGDAFESDVSPVPDDVIARSTWSPGCPVTRDELAYVTVTFWGFDGRPHTGELLVHVDVADGVVQVFRDLFAARFPIEEMRVVDAPELDLPPTGDGNNTTAFVCRPSRGSTRWSEHAYGRAIDVNPFLNPYEKGDVVLPELATSYLDRSNVRPGMILPGDAVTTAFAAQGWQWGGDWTSPLDLMHFSPSGR